MSSVAEYRDVERIGEIALDNALVEQFIHYLESTELPETHNIYGDEASDSPYDARGNTGYNKYIVHDDIFARFFNNTSEYEYFLQEVIHTFPLSTGSTKQEAHMINALTGAIYQFFTEYYKKFFLLRVSVSITEPESLMHYHKDLAGENADRFLVDLTLADDNLSGIEVEGRLYNLERLVVYKLDTTREHRAANYSPKNKKISFIIQCISELDQYLEYQRKHLLVCEESEDQGFDL